MASHRNVKRNSGRNKMKKENSKKIVDWLFYLCFAYFAYMFYMMKITLDLSPAEYMADILKVTLAIGVPAYMYRAVMTDKVEIQLKYKKESSELKKKYGENYIEEELSDPEFLNKS